MLRTGLAIALILLLGACANDSGTEYDYGVPKNSEQQRADLTRKIDGGTLSGRPLADLHVERGFLWLREGNGQLALADFQRAVEILPQEPDMLTARAVGYLTVKNFDAGIADATGVIDMRPDDDTAGLMLRAHILTEKGDHKAALADYDEVLRRDPTQWTVHGYRGMVLAAQGDDEAALKEMNRAIELDTGSVGTQKVRKGVIYGGSPIVNSWLVTEDISSDGFVAKLYGRIGRIWFKRGDYEKAREAFNATFVVHDSHAYEALTVMTFGRCSRARRLLERNARLYGVPVSAVLAENREFIATTECAGHEF
jgi:tetratricopeptide (TPR) repeat protein